MFKDLGECFNCGLELRRVKNVGRIEIYFSFIETSVPQYWRGYI